MGAVFTKNFGLDIIMRHDYSGEQLSRINVYREGSFHYLVKYFENYPKAREFKTAIDIGCGDTFIVDKFKSLGLECEGIDLYSDCEGVEKTDFYKLSERGKTYDVVFCNHTLEHADSVYRLMEQMSAITNPGGLLFIAIPDADADWAWDLYQSTTHFSILNYGFLDTTMKRFGFQTMGTKVELRPGAKELWFIGIKK